MKFVSRYESCPADDKGYVNYPQQDHDTWAYLYNRQIQVLPGRAVKEYITGIEKLELSIDKIPQLPDVSQKLHSLTGWQVVPVAAVISSESFFKLLANRQFPVATFIRRFEDLDYITEPDVFHEIFGHVPLLTFPGYADFMQKYAQIALSFPKEDWNLFLRLFWFTVEFGLIQTKEGMRIYGGGILSSYGETTTCLQTTASYHAYFNPVTALRTPYRIDMIQPIYFVISNYETLFNLLTFDFAELFQSARTQGLFLPLFPKKEEQTEVNLGRY